MKTNKLFPKKVFFLLSWLLPAALFAQTTPPPKQWDKRFGGSSGDQLTSLQQTTDNGYILGGYSYSGISGDKTEDSRGDWDCWIVKIDASGAKQWDKRFGGNSYDDLNALQQTTDGGYIFGGESSSGIDGDKTEGNRGYVDYWIVKTDANGIKQWDKRFGGNMNDQLSSLQQTTDGGYILGGSSTSGAGGDKTQDSRGLQDYWVVKIDANGIKQWDKRFGGSGDDELRFLQQTTDGAYILGGHSQSGIEGDKTEDSRGLQDYWVLKIDANGVKRWDKRFGGSDPDWFSSLQQTSDGGYILGGYSRSGTGGDKTEDSRGEYDFWIVKINANGTKQWDKRFGGVYGDYLYALRQLQGGGYILGGGSYSGISGDKTKDSRGGSDYWTVKIDSTGIKQWDQSFGGSSDDYLSSLQQTSDGGYVSGGTSWSGISGDKTEDSRGGIDYWIVKSGCPPPAVITATGNLDICATGSVLLKVNATDTLQYRWLRNREKIPGATRGWYVAKTPGFYKVVVYTDKSCKNVSNVIKVTKSCGPLAESDNGSSFTLHDSPFTISPNPSKGNITVGYYSSIAGATQLNIFDITGKKLFTKTVQAIAGSNVWQLNLAMLAAGVYNLQLNNGGEAKNVRFVVEK